MGTKEGGKTTVKYTLLLKGVALGWGENISMKEGKGKRSQNFRGG